MKTLEEGLDKTVLHPLAQIFSLLRYIPIMITKPGNKPFLCVVRKITNLKGNMKFVQHGDEIQDKISIEFYNIVKKNKWFTTKSRDWEGVDPYSEGIVDFPNMTHERLEMLVKWSYRAYYLRPQYIYRRLKNLKSFRELFEDAKIAFKLFFRRRLI